MRVLTSSPGAARFVGPPDGGALECTMTNPNSLMRVSRAAVLLLALAPQLAIAETHRDPAQSRAFVKEHPCPSTGKTKGRCPGYVVDHIKPLCAWWCRS